MFWLLHENAKEIKRNGIISLCALVTVIGMPVAFILSMLSGIKFLSTNWVIDKIEHKKVFWGILCFVPFFGPIFAIILGSKLKKAYEPYSMEYSINDVK